MELSQILHNCNPAQKQAILHDHSRGGPLLILAGAGSGKTSVLTRRIQWLITQNNVPPSCILGLTFTAKAAHEMLERVGNSLVKLCTFHSLALALLREYGALVGFVKPPSPTDLSLRHYEEAIVLAGLKAGSVPRDQLFAPEKSAKICQALLPIQRECFETGKVVFEDLIWLAIHLLQTHAEVLRTIRIRWTHILVDEYQDINPSQYLLIRQLSGEGPNLFVVGDDDQAIYGFRGADIGNILRFHKDYPACTVVKLEWNYRSTAPILDVANRIFNDKPPLLRKRLRPGSSRKDELFQAALPVEIWQSPHPQDELDRLCGTMEEMRSRYGLAHSGFALLVRYNRQIEWYSAALRARGIPLGEPSGVHIETIHGSKGLQYPVVFYCGLAKSISPGLIKGNSAQKRAQEAEEKRLFYVGVTRAEARLILLFCTRRHWQGKLQNFESSPFLQYIPTQTLPKTRRRFSVVLLFKIVVALKLFAFMGWSMVQYIPVRLFRRKEIPAWIERKLDTWAKYCLQVLKMQLTVKGQANVANIDWSRPVFVVANHQSYTDIPTILVSLERLLGFIAKRELALIPFMGYWMIQIGCLLINRSKSGVGNDVNDAIKKMKKAPNLVVFPEGTRSKNGQMQSFKSGAFRMAIDNRGIILPLAITGSRSGWEGRQDANQIQPYSCDILEPIDCEKLLLENPKFSHKELKDLAQNQIRTKLAEIRY
jgi:1-acyl-sn-glycerol-3-phosphate acyltransferase